MWWLVSPQNPLKPAAGMAEFEERLRDASAVAQHPRIRVSDLERRLGTRHTADTLRVLLTRFHRIAFVWIMGADNLAQLPQWKNWTAIFALVPIAVFDRPTYSYQSLAGKAARRYVRFRLGSTKARRLAHHEPPAWVFVRARLHPESGTHIRAGAAAGGHPRQAEATRGADHS